MTADLNRALIEGFDKWLTVQNHSQHTRVNYCHDIRKLAEYAGQASLLELKRADIMVYLAGLRNARAKGKQLGRPKKILDTKRIAMLRAKGVG